MRRGERAHPVAVRPHAKQAVGGGQVGLSDKVGARARRGHVAVGGLLIVAIARRQRAQAHPSSARANTSPHGRQVRWERVAASL